MDVEIGVCNADRVGLRRGFQSIISASGRVAEVVIRRRVLQCFRTLGQLAPAGWLHCMVGIVAVSRFVGCSGGRARRRGGDWQT